MELDKAGRLRGEQRLGGEVVSEDGLSTDVHIHAYQLSEGVNQTSLPAVCVRNNIRVSKG